MLSAAEWIKKSLDEKLEYVERWSQQLDEMNETLSAEDKVSYETTYTRCISRVKTAVKTFRSVQRTRMGLAEQRSQVACRPESILEEVLIDPDEILRDEEDEIDMYLLEVDYLKCMSEGHILVAQNTHNVEAVRESLIRVSLFRPAVEFACNEWKIALNNAIEMWKNVIARPQSETARQYVVAMSYFETAQRCQKHAEQFFTVCSPNAQPSVDSHFQALEVQIRDFKTAEHEERCCVAWDTFLLFLAATCSGCHAALVNFDRYSDSTLNGIIATCLGITTGICSWFAAWITVKRSTIGKDVDNKRNDIVAHVKTLHSHQLSQARLGLRDGVLSTAEIAISRQTQAKAEEDMLPQPAHAASRKTPTNCCCRRLLRRLLAKMEKAL